MEFKLEAEKVHEASSIQIQVPTPRFCAPKYSPFTQSVMNLTPIHQFMSTPTLYMNPISPEQSFRQFTQISLFEVDTPRISRRVIKKIDFSQYFEKFGQIRANTLPVEIKVYQDDAFEHSSLLTSLSKSKPAKRPRNQQSAKLGCTCPKSKCLKLYCECFARQDFCDGCNCKDCHNTSKFEEIRNEAVKATLDRNPNAFVPKIAGRQTGPVHRKGCHCSKSGCLLNYCECFQSGAVCSDMCQCSGCRNNEVIKKKKKRSNV